MIAKKDRLNAIIWVLIAGVFITLLKFYAYYLTHSNAILTDALENIINIIAGSFAFYSIYLSSLPKDLNHPYGHGKVEFFAVGFEGSLILIAGITIIYKSIVAIMHPNSINHLADGIWITTIAGLANYLLGTYLIKRGKKLNSIVLSADGKHLMSDAYTSLGLIVGLIIIKLTGYILLDSILSILLGGLILHNGYQLLRHSVAGLMDEIDPKVVDQIVKILGEARKDTWVDVHNLRAQKYGADLHIDCHLTLPHYWHLNQMHDEVHAIELLMKEQAATQVELFIHVDPCLPQCCFYCAVPNCKERQTEQNSTIPWTKKNIMKNTKHFVD